MDAVTLHAARNAIGFVCLLSALVFVARLVEISIPVQPDPPRAQAWLDYKIVAVCLILPWSLSWVTTLTSAALISALGGGGLIRLRAEGWWFPPSLLVYLIAYDFYRYWMHRLQHVVPWLWSIHSLHHSAQTLSFITGARHHWLDSVLNKGLFVLLPTLFLIPPEITLIGSVITFFPDTCAHLNVRLPLGRYALLINNPQYHRIHHSADPRHFDKNFAAVFPVWDILFGTAWRPAKDEFPSTGLADGDRPRNVWDGVVWPFRRLPGVARGLVSQRGQG